EAAGPGALAEHLRMPVQDGTIDIPGGPRVRVDGDALVADTLAINPGVPPLLQDLPDTTGCRVHVPLLDKGMRLGMLLPEDGTTPILIRARGPEPPPAVLQEAPSAPVGGSSHATPFLVATLGVSPLALLLDPTVQTALAGTRGAAMDFRAMEHSSVQVLPGATLALFMSGDGPQGVVILPVSNRHGRDIRVRSVTRTIGRIAERGGARVTRMGPSGLRIEGPKRTFTFVVQADRVVVGTHTDATLHAATGRGDPWVRPSLDDLARTHAVSMIMDTAAMFPGMKAVGVELGLGATEQAWQLELRLSGDPEMLAMFMESLRRSIAGAGLPEP
ncbi:MAG: hypothetical protein VX000_09465, partial [Myxococcota bacterium]|nr:hypothetical protein [Myxococcota bacterium]